ncbi:hypothetical protein [Sphingopyxis sp. MWB1]|uniref:hypothetical protein n=1 Tax=Sphingopyxis sp. MWB1 TaxID=1537715 RepID=UPI001185C88D|nr:hypothetical protein [Sphingopyxis sp. MWB1]
MMADHRWATILLLALLSGCGEERAVPIDYCKPEGRKISNSERISQVLVTLANNEDEISDKWKFDGGVHFLEWRSKFKSENPNVSDLDISYEYYLNFPSCCEVLPPAYLDHENVSDLEWDDRIAESLKRKPGFWVVDVKVSRKIPVPASRKPTDSIVLGLSDCNNNVNYRGYPYG